MKNIEEIRDKHKGESLIIVGSGPSLDTYPDNFLDDKISMTLHLAYLKFSNPTYTHIAEADRILWFKKNRPNLFKSKGLYCTPFVPLVHPNSILKEINMESIYFLKYTPIRLKFKNVEKQIMAADTGKNIRYQSNSTCLHTGIWCALILGFTTINLIGCDFSHQEEKHYSSIANVCDSRARNLSFFENAYYRMNIFTTEIIRILKKHRIVINRYLNYEDYQKNN